MASPSLSAVSANLAGQLNGLAERYGFDILGTDKIEDEPPIRVSGPLYTQLKEILFEYNHIVLRAPNQGVKRIIVLGRKQPAPEMPETTGQTEGEGAAAEGADTSEVPTQRQGDHHIVTASLTGPNDQQLSQQLMIDTGASLVVLPLSRAAQLGFDAARLSTREVQTVKGKHSARVGKLKALALGDKTVSGVDVAFIEDKLVGSTALLGMNVLSRFRMTIDDQRNVLTLEPPKKSNAAPSGRADP